MKIIEVNLTENITKSVGLKPVSMKKIGNIVLLAGKNGSGKTRILNLIRQEISNSYNFIIEQQRAKNNIINNQQEISNQFVTKQQLEENIKNAELAIQNYKQQIEKDPKGKLFLEPKIKNFESSIKNYKQQIENQPKRKEELENEIKRYKLIVETPIPIIHDNQVQNITVIDFVPNKIELEDWARQSKQDWIQRANQSTTPGVLNLYQTTTPLIQKVIENWVNTSHPRLEFSKDEINNATADYERLQSIIKSFLGVEIGYNKDGYSTIFDKPIAQAQLSAGQRVLLQLCVAIFAQGGTLSNHIIFMDEPENHLHPSAVIDLLDTIKEHNPNGQIWIATHSIPLLSHFETSSLWFVEDGVVKHSGKKPEVVLQSLLGDENRIQKLRDFTSLPSELARNRFAFECLLPDRKSVV